MAADYDNCLGCILGILFGDAIGAYYDGLSPKQIKEQFTDAATAYNDSLKSPRLRISDNARMMLSLVRYLGDHETINPKELMRYFAEDYDSSRSFGRGSRSMLDHFFDPADKQIVAMLDLPDWAYSSGAAVRNGPLGLCLMDHPYRLRQEAKIAAYITHPNSTAVAAAVSVAVTASFAASVTDVSPMDLRDLLLPGCPDETFQYRIFRLSQVTHNKHLKELGNRTVAYESTAAALACFALHSCSFRDAVSTAISLGGDTISIAAIAGGLVGAHLGACIADDLPLDNLEDGQSFMDHVRYLTQRMVDNHVFVEEPNSSRRQFYSF